MKKVKNESSFDLLNGPDSLWNRLSSKKSMKNGKTTQQMLDIEDDGMEPLGGKKKLSLMDIVNNMYEQGEFYEESEE